MRARKVHSSERMMATVTVVMMLTTVKVIDLEMMLFEQRKGIPTLNLRTWEVHP
jgi:hypothetical protein